MDGISHSDTAAGPGAQTVPPAAPNPRRRAVFIAVIVVVLAAAAFGGWRYYQSASQYESTDDAFIDGHISDVAAQIGGRVISLVVDDNQPVTAGQLLLTIDPRDQQVHLAQARARRAAAAATAQQMQAQMVLQQANIDQASANAEVTQADLTSARQDLARFRGIDPAAITRQQLDTASATAGAAVARLDANRQAVVAARAQLVASAAALAGAQAQLTAADADVASAELQLSYATVTAPVGGIVARRSVALGNYINAGQALMAIVPNDVWVTANFKETQVGHMHAGQAVDIVMDQYPGLTFHGHVDSFQTGTGAVFSALPAENATGNYVKVVQRVPVKIRFDQGPPDGGSVPADLRLAPGLSVTPRVKLH